MSTLENLTKNIANHALAIAEIEEMLNNLTLSRQNKELAEYTCTLLQNERLEFIAKAVTLQNLHFYREMKEENDLPKRS